MSTPLPPVLNNRDWVEKYKTGNFNVPMEKLIAETQLLALGNIIPLSIKIDTDKFRQEIAKYDGQWCNYLPRTDRVNNRQALAVVSYPGFSYNEAPSLPEVRNRAQNQNIKEIDINQPTEIFEHCTSLHPILKLFPDLGRTFLVKLNMGGYFVPHRDHPNINRDVFRVIVFLNKCGKNEYDFIFDRTSLEIEEGRCYAINTMLTHRTFSFVDDSIHLVMNIPMTLENSLRILSNLQHRH